MSTIFNLIGGAADWQQTGRLIRFATSRPGLIPETARIELTVLSANAHQPLTGLLGHRQDHDLFQDKTVIEIVDEFLGDWKSQGKLGPTGAGIWPIKVTMPSGAWPRNIRKPTSPSSNAGSPKSQKATQIGDSFGMTCHREPVWSTAIPGSGSVRASAR